MVLNGNHSIEIFPFHQITSSEDSSGSWQLLTNSIPMQTQPVASNGATISVKVRKIWLKNTKNHYWFFFDLIYVENAEQWIERKCTERASTSL